MYTLFTSDGAAHIAHFSRAEICMPLDSLLLSRQPLGPDYFVYCLSFLVTSALSIFLAFSLVIGPWINSRTAYKKEIEDKRKKLRGSGKGFRSIRWLLGLELIRPENSGNSVSAIQS